MPYHAISAAADIRRGQIAQGFGVTDSLSLSFISQVERAEFCSGQGREWVAFPLFSYALLRCPCVAWNVNLCLCQSFSYFNCYSASQALGRSRWLIAKSALPSPCFPSDLATRVNYCVVSLIKREILAPLTLDSFILKAKSHSHSHTLTRRSKERSREKERETEREGGREREPERRNILLKLPSIDLADLAC